MEGWIYALASRLKLLDQHLNPRNQIGNGKDQVNADVNQSHWYQKVG